MWFREERPKRLDSEDRLPRQQKFSRKRTLKEHLRLPFTVVVEQELYRHLWCTMIEERNRKRTIEESTTGSLLQNLKNMYMFRA
jgi:hypothetical protein